MARLSLCMIARDNEKIIQRCLESIKPWVDEMIVVDTGSTDRTPQIAESLGARVGYFPWCDDFSAARNQSIEHATGEWLFWMDTDDTIPEQCGQQLRQLADSDHHPSVLAYVMQTHCLGKYAGDMTTVDHVKLFRNHPEIRFEFRIHEQLLPSIRRLGGEVVSTRIFVEHHGSNLEGQEKQGKYDRDFRILGLEIEERPDHPFALFNLGMTYSDMGEHEQAIEYLQRSIEHSGENDSQLAKACALYAGSLCSLKRWNEAVELCEQWLAKYPQDAELTFRRSIALHELGDLSRSEEGYRQVLSRGPLEDLSSIDPGILGHKARHNLALVIRDSQRSSEAELQFRKAVMEAPAYVPTRRALVEHLLASGRLHSAEHEISKLAELAPNGIEAPLMRAELLARRAEFDRSRVAFEELWAIEKARDNVFDSYSRFLFEHGPDGQAENVLRWRLNREPDRRASVLHNLGVVLSRTGRHKEAIECLSQSLALRPDSPDTETQLKLASAAAEHNPPGN